MKTIEITKSMVENSPLKDFVYLLNQTLSNIEDNTTIILEKGTYDLRRTFSMDRFCYISNNDSGMKNIAFYIEGKKNIVIDGQGSHLNCIGRILPFYINQCENVTVKNFSIDYARAFMSQGEVIATTETSADLRIDTKEFPIRCRQNTFAFLGEDYESDHVHGLLEYYKETKRPIANVFDNSVCGALAGEILEEGLIRIWYNWRQIPQIGNILTIKHEHRLVPAITLDCCKDVVLEYIWIKQAGTMGVVAQLCENVKLNHVDVYSDPSSQRVFSINADATHFVNCCGDVIVENGRFESMLDDVINVHGNYLRIDKVDSDTKVMVCIPHFQQEGFLNFRVADKIGICEQETMMTKGYSSIKAIEKINQRYYYLTLETPFEFDENLTYCIDNVEMYPRVIFRGNDCGRNRARGLILTSTKETIVENNIIDSEGSAIKINSDMKSWYESAAISNVIIRNNKLTRKNHINWGVALIDIDPGMKQQIEGTPFHGNMIIENNEILLEESPLFYGYSFGTVSIKNNKITIKNNVKENDWDYLVQTSNCLSVEIADNEFNS